jgi:Tfp pilus assembly protein PilF
LQLGMQQFEDATYVDAARHLQLALDMGLTGVERAEAHKVLAFIHCASGREAACREEFQRAFASDPDFMLNDAERGHPVWGPVFASVKAGPRKAPVEPAQAKVAPNADPALQTGLRLYEDGAYAESAKSLQAAIDQGLAPKDRARAHKYLAFIHCASSREQLCREEFRKALAVEPALELAPEEAGHPVWGPIFRSLKAAK